METKSENKTSYDVKDEHGTKYWYLDGQLHRDDGPAIEHMNGSRKWYKHGKLHRIGGPAIENADGSEAWYIEGRGYMWIDEDPHTS
jgi:hypothetical protein